MPPPLNGAALCANSHASSATRERSHTIIAPPLHPAALLRNRARAHVTLHSERAKSAPPAALLASGSRVKSGSLFEVGT